jgi:hypothetical protein
METPNEGQSQPQAATPKRSIRLGDFNIDEDLAGWAIVNEVGVGRWLGKIDTYDKATRTMSLHPAFELSSPSRAPVLAVSPGQGQVEGVISGFNCDFVLRQNSTHPIEDIYVSSVQHSAKWGPELRSYCYNIIAEAIRGPVDPKTGKRVKRT